jgi:hypothetical protein
MTDLLDRLLYLNSGGSERVRLEQEIMRLEEWRGFIRKLRDSERIAASAQPQLGKSRESLPVEPEERNGDTRVTSTKAPLKSWQDLEIRFLSTHRLQIFRNGEAAETLNYAEMGL